MEPLGASEVGLAHPTLPLAVRLMDNGQVALMAGDDCGIVFDSKTGSVTVFGNRLDFVFDEIRVDGKPVSKSRITSDEKMEWSNIVNRGLMRDSIVRSGS